MQVMVMKAPVTQQHSVLFSVAVFKQFTMQWQYFENDSAHETAGNTRNNVVHMTGQQLILQKKHKHVTFFSSTWKWRQGLFSDLQRLEPVSLLFCFQVQQMLLLCRQMAKMQLKFFVFTQKVCCVNRALVIGVNWSRLTPAYEYFSCFCWFHPIEYYFKGITYEI